MPVLPFRARKEELIDWATMRAAGLQLNARLVHHSHRLAGAAASALARRADERLQQRPCPASHPSETRPRHRQARPEPEVEKARAESERSPRLA